MGKEYLIVFMEKSAQFGNLIYNGKMNLKDIKKEISKEFGHSPNKTLILNIIKMSS